MSIDDLFNGAFFCDNMGHFWSCHGSKEWTIVNITNDMMQKYKTTLARIKLNDCPLAKIIQNYKETKTKEYCNEHRKPM